LKSLTERMAAIARQLDSTALKACSRNLFAVLDRMPGSVNVLNAAISTPRIALNQHGFIKPGRENSIENYEREVGLLDPY